MTLCQKLKPDAVGDHAEIVCDGAIGLGGDIIEDLSLQGFGWLQNDRRAHRDPARRIEPR